MSVVVERAVVPAAGLGTRMLPITKSIPKEMLPVGEKPMIQVAIEELSASGIRKIAIVIRQGKEVIREYLLSKYPYSQRQDKSIVELEELVAGVELSFVFQEKLDGLAGALLAARDFVDDNPFVMLIPDQLIYGSTPATAQLVSKYIPDPSSVYSSLVQLPKKEVPYFIGSSGFEFEIVDHPRVRVNRLLTEEETSLLYKEAEFEVRGIGRTILPPAIFDYLAAEKVNPTTGEIDYKRAVGRYIEHNPHYGVLLQGIAFDLGTFEGYYRYLPRIWQLTVEQA